MIASRLAARSGTLTALVVGLVVLGPTLGRAGFVLHYDMVFVPHLPLSPATLGTDGGVPRAVPNDLVVALLDVVLPGWIVQRLVLLGAFVAIGAGVDRWRRGALAPAVAALAACWNPWMAERLAIGHWGYLWGFAALVWAVVGALEYRRRTTDSIEHMTARAETTMLVGLVMGAASGSTGAVLVAASLAVLLAAPGPGRMPVRHLLVGAALWLALDAAWWWPFLTLASSAADPAGVAAFASRADTPLGVFGSVLSGGGIWHEPSWFWERSSTLVALLAAGLFVAGFTALVRASSDRASRSGLLLLAVLGLVLSAGASVPGGMELTRWAVVHVPGGGLIRDAQKFAALWIVPCCLGLGVLASTAARRFRGTTLAAVAVAACLALPVVTLPGLAFARGGAWQSVSYPNEYLDVARQLDADEGSGRVAVLPWTQYRRYAWNPSIVLDPWPRLLSRPVVVNDDLPLRHEIVRGENASARAIREALESHDARRLRTALGQAGVTTVIIERDQPDAQVARSLISAASPEAQVTHDGAGLIVMELTTDAAASDAPASPWWRAVGLGSSLLGLFAAVGIAARRRRSRAGWAVEPGKTVRSTSHSRYSGE